VRGGGLAGGVLMPGDVAGDSVDQVASGGDRQQHNAGVAVVTEADDPPIMVGRDADVGGQSQRLQHVQQAVLVKGHNLRPGPAPQAALPQPPGARGAAGAICRAGEVSAAARGNQRDARAPVGGEALFQRRARRERELAIADQDEVGLLRHCRSGLRQAPIAPIARRSSSHNRGASGAGRDRRRE
jgi:hypothetical protein